MPFHRLICSNCGVALTGAVTLLPPNSAESAGLVFEDAAPMTPAGTVFVSTEPMQWSADGANKPPLEFAPQHWINPADVDMTVEPVADVRRLNGCCGLDGCDGPNMRCRACGVEVGTRQSDCWTSDVFIAEPGQTHWMEVNT